VLRGRRIEKELFVDTWIEGRTDRKQLKSFSKRADEPTRHECDKVGFGRNVESLEITRHDNTTATLHSESREPIVYLIGGIATPDNRDMPRGKKSFGSTQL
jgi:hypothetical protein